MDLWIRSQDKRTLVNTRRIDIDDNKIIIWDEGKYASEVFMGEYATKERALEILDEIEKLIKPITIFENCEVDKSTIEKIKETGYCVVNNDARVEQFSQVFYQMPKE